MYTVVKYKLEDSCRILSKSDRWFAKKKFFVEISKTKFFYFFRLEEVPEDKGPSHPIRDVSGGRPKKRYFYNIAVSPLELVGNRNFPD